MIITRHSSNDELMDLQLASDQRALAPTLAALADCERAAADRPEGFWQQQQAEIRRRVAASDPGVHRPLGRVAWATAFALVLLAAILFGSGSVPAPRPAATSDADQQLLQAVEQAVQSDVPESLEPASLLTEEMGLAAQVNSSAHPKENTDEN